MKSNVVHIDPAGRAMMRWGIIAFALFVFLLSFDYFRDEILGIVGPHDVGFIILFYLPLPTGVVVLVLCGLVINEVLFQWKDIVRPRNKLIPLLLTVPIVGLFLIILASILRT